MIYLAGILVLVLLMLRATSPTRHAVHANRAIPLPPRVKPTSPYIAAGFLRDEHGKRMDVSGKFIGQAVRNSMERFGIPDGTTFVADYMSKAQKRRLKKGDIVVVNGEHVNSEVGFRLRCITSVAHDKITFMAGRRWRPLDQIVAKVVYVVDADPAPTRGIFLNFMHKFLASK